MDSAGGDADGLPESRYEISRIPSSQALDDSKFISWVNSKFGSDQSTLMGPWRSLGPHGIPWGPWMRSPRALEGACERNPRGIIPFQNLEFAGDLSVSQCCKKEKKYNFISFSHEKSLNDCMKNCSLRFDKKNRAHFCVRRKLIYIPEVE